MNGHLQVRAVIADIDQRVRGCVDKKKPTNSTPSSLLKEGINVQRPLLKSARAATVAIVAAALACAASVSLTTTAARASGSTGGGDLIPLAATRIANTVNGTGGLGSTPFSIGETRNLIVNGTGGIPTENVSAAVLQITASNASSAGTLTVYSDDDGEPDTTALAYPVGTSSSGFDIVAVGSDGGINIKSETGNPDVSVTVEGYITEGSGVLGAGGYVPLTQTRIFDTLSTPIPAGSTRTIQVSGANGVPNGANAIFANLNVVAASGSGGLTVWPSENTEPTVSTMRWNGGTSSSGASLDLGVSGNITMHNTGNQAISVTVDLDGYFGNGSSTDGSAFFTANDQLYRTQSGGDPVLAAGSFVTINVARESGDLPTPGLMIAAAVTVAVSNTSATGALTVYPADAASRPSTVDLSYDNGDNTSALTITRTSTDGAVRVYNAGTAAVDLSVSVVGWFMNPDGTDVGASSFDEMPDLAVQNELPSLESTVGSEGAGEDVGPNDVEGGFYLKPTTKIDATHYKGAYEYIGNYHCTDDDCWLTNEVRGLYKETLNGGQSRLWDNYAQVTYMKGSHIFDLYYEYKCAVNETGQADDYCSDYYDDGAHENEDGAFNSPNNFWYSFGSTNSVKKYPMFGITVDWPTGSNAEGKWRGYDVCTSATHNILCSSSGTGH